MGYPLRRLSEKKEHFTEIDLRETLAFFRMDLPGKFNREIECLPRSRYSLCEHVEKTELSECHCFAVIVLILTREHEALLQQLLGPSPIAAQDQAVCKIVVGLNGKSYACTLLVFLYSLFVETDGLAQFSLQ